MSKNIAVVGGGPGGYAAAFYAADLGMQVTLIDENVNPGGVCLYVGCIPSKALLHVAAVIHEAEHAKAWGVEFDSGKVVGHDRIAVMVALNLANELMRLKNRDSKLESDVVGRVRSLRERVEGALEKGQQLEL